MKALLVDHELLIRLLFFFGIFAVIAIWELIAPRRTLRVAKSSRWINNIAIIFINSILLRLLFPTAVAGVALFSQAQGSGLFNYFSVPFWLAVILSVVILDFIIYLQHIMFHAVPLLWRVHRMHHTDLDFDVTTGMRFHPIEILISLMIKFATVMVLGAPAVAVLIFEVALNGTSMFNHGNIRILKPIDRVIRWLIVTPDMHRVHHSIIVNETNSNFGFNLSIWDRLFGTYRDQPKAGHKDMDIGITTFRQPQQCVNLLGLLETPFLKKMADYPINRRK